MPTSICGNIKETIDISNLYEQKGKKLTEECDKILLDVVHFGKKVSQVKRGNDIDKKHTDIQTMKP